MLSRTIMMGRLTRDPELRYTQTEIPVVSFRIAVDRDYVRRGEERKADFFDCQAWRNTAEFISKFFTKGRLIVVEGRFEVQEYTDRDGINRRNAVLTVENAYFGDSKKPEDDDASAAGSKPAGDPVNVEYDEPEGRSSAFRELNGAGADEELPF